ncbi:HlyD family secretion protein [Mesorhizobium sp. CA13]|uniref:HlyD family secretion protein n=1 Tax=Mesorhizobium sp. CA13 TaxID=2876643 RepID=UPI001CCF4E41|nr:HlyD family secretion protein [Mesorhizobium sp. CA13]MBZ9857321.1 HlyD family secretion protein [Mesorhizobium sp. CA13]
MNVSVNPAILEYSVEVKPAPRSRKTMIKRTVVGLGLVAGLTGAALYGYDYWTAGQYLQSTDDAYIKADYTAVAPKISGHIAEVLVEDNTHVKAGQVLARIDDRDFRTALDQAQAKVEAAEATLHNLDAQIGLQQSVIEQQKANVAATEAKLKFAQQEGDRYKTLLKSGYGTSQRAQQAAASLSESEAQLQRDRAALVAARKAIDVLTTERSKAEAERNGSQAALRQAKLNLSYTTITAPVDGIVGARSLRVGQYVQAGTLLMAVVPLNAIYVVANFKETQLAHVQSGQPVEIAVDGFPGVALKGRVDSVSPASGLEFALLPPDNATGNFTKIVQRIPVKIAINDGRLAGKLRAGMSAEPTIDTKATILAQRGEPDSGRRIIAGW